MRHQLTRFKRFLRTEDGFYFLMCMLVAAIVAVYTALFP